jgi:hypothetical protein
MSRARAQGTQMWAAWLAASIFVTACSHDAARDSRTSPRRVSESAAALTGGLSAPAAPTTGLVHVYGGAGECTGQLLTHEWVITAAHCFCVSDANSDATMSSTHAQVALGSEYAKATVVQLHPTLDVALLRLERMFPLEKPLLLWTGDSSALVHRQVACQGYEHSSADAGPPAEATVEVVSAGTELGIVPSSCSTGSGASGQVDGLRVALPGGDGDAGAALDALDAGAPCFVDEAGQRYLVGVVSGSAPSDHRVGWVNGIDALHAWIKSSTDIWTAAECSADVSGSQFALDPMVFVGTPNGAVMTLVAQHAYGVPGDPRVIVAQNTGVHFGVWSPLPSPPSTDDMLAIGASAAGLDSANQSYLLQLYYLDGQHQERSGLFYDFSLQNWVTSDHQPYPGVGVLTSSVSARVGMDLSVSFPLWVSDQGVVETNVYVASTYNTMTPVNAFLDMPVPPDAPIADATRRPSLIYNPFTSFMLAGYRALNGKYVAYAGNGGCFVQSDSRSPWCPSLLVPLDLPVSNVRDVGLGITTRPTDMLWTVTVESDNQMRLWSVSSTGHAVDYGLVGDNALGMVKTVPYEPLPGYQSLFVSYTAEDWSARVRPVGNCLGNTPPGW